MHLRTRRARLLVAATALVAPIGVLATIQPAAAAPTGLVTIKSTLPRWLPKTKGRVALAVPDADATKKLGIRVYLAPNGGADALAQAALAVSTPGSASYGQFLSADQFHRAYAPTAATEKTVRTFLTSHGLTVTGTAPFRRYVEATGTVAQLDKAFDVSLKQYTHDKQHVVAPSTAAQLPAKVASAVLTVDGLDTTKVVLKVPSATEPPAGYRNGRPCSQYFGQLTASKQADYKTPLPKFKDTTLSYAPCGYTGTQFRSAYEGDTTLTGSGATIAITDAYRWQNIAYDANRYAENHGDGSYVPGQLAESLPKGYDNEDLCGPSGWSGEETLDVEAVHAMAPDAKIRYYAASNCLDTGLTDALARVADDGLVQAVTNSWGDTEYNTSAESIPIYESIFHQSALEGISVFFSSGDNGDELANSGFKQADYPASDPSVTAVGGTSTLIDGDGVRSQPDQGWGTRTYSLSKDGKSWTPGGFLYGAGGGVSTLFNQPSYQQKVVAPQHSNGRAVPDLAMDADPQTGMLIGQTQKFSDGTYYGEYRIGGTSLASPLMAGLTALAVEHNGGQGFGLMNPVIYKRTDVLTDVTAHYSGPYGVVRANYLNSENSSGGLSYLVRTFGQDSSLPVTKGWDQVTGRGVPNTRFLTLTTPKPTTAAAKR